ncbi:hypothetical protein PybrP1_004399 [[Pythium] brassicae (nom. inval.)]|nr:hypothetical protein PybrP1_004399 [[Pythium] brassicae (nom. inval.)]
MASSTSSGLGWERFEELTKAVVGANPHGGTRFFLKTRVQRGRGVQIVVRVAGGDRSATYRTALPNRLARLTRLLRVVMQELLGPTQSACASSASSTAAAAGVSNATTTPPSTTKSTKAKKKKNAKKK